MCTVSPVVDLGDRIALSDRFAMRQADDPLLGL
jgi:hypothetical protein